MLNDLERARFNELRDRRDHSLPLSDEELAEIAMFTRRLEEAEATYLAPATERIRLDNRTIDTRLQAIHNLIAQEERFIGRLHQTLEELQREREFIKQERQRLFAGAA